MPNTGDLYIIAIGAVVLLAAVLLGWLVKSGLTDAHARTVDYADAHALRVERGVWGDALDGFAHRGEVAEAPGEPDEDVDDVSPSSDEPVPPAEIPEETIRLNPLTALAWPSQVFGDPALFNMIVADTRYAALNNKPQERQTWDFDTGSWHALNPGRAA